MSPLFNSLLFIHIVFGFTAISAAMGAILATKGQPVHIFCGRTFVAAMTGIVITAIPMSIIIHDAFLFLIALFSYYFALSGWMYARNRTGIASTFAWTISIIMLGVGLAMLGYSLFYLPHNDYQSTVLTIFGILGCLIAISDLKTHYYKNAVGNFRIIKHLSAMLGATIATLTAFTVVNIHTHPAYLAWIGPTILITPLIFYWRYRVSKWSEAVA